MKNNNTPVKPLLKWAGGKTSLAPEIYKHFIKVKKLVDGGYPLALN